MAVFQGTTRFVVASTLSGSSKRYEVALASLSVASGLSASVRARLLARAQLAASSMLSGSVRWAEMITNWMAAESSLQASAVISSGRPIVDQPILLPTTKVSPSSVGVRRIVDVRLKQTFDIEGPTMDWFLRKDGRLDEREELATAVRVALGTDHLAAATDVLPDPDSTWRRGWWGDLEAEEIWNGWDIGTKNWLLTRAKITEAPSEEGSTLDRARQYTQDSLQPLIEQRIASRIDVFADRTELNRIEVTATIFRGPLAEIDLRYQLLWEDMEAIEFDTFGVVPIIVDKSLRPPSANLRISIELPIAKLSNIEVPGGNLRLTAYFPFGIKTTALPANLLLSSVEPLVARGVNRITAQGSLTLSPTVPFIPFPRNIQPAQTNAVLTKTAPFVSSVTATISISDFVTAPPSLDSIPAFSIGGYVELVSAQLAVSKFVPSVLVEGVGIFDKHPTDKRLAISGSAPSVLISTSSVTDDVLTIGGYAIGSSPLGT